MVYEKILWRSSAAAPWQVITTTAPHPVSMGLTNDTRYVDLTARGACQPIEFRVEMYRVGQSAPDAIRDGSNEPGLAGVKQESYLDDNVVAVVLNAWWPDMVDADGDGCEAPDRPTKLPRLSWTMQLSGNGVQEQVREQIWSKAANETNWTLLATTPAHSMSNQLPQTFHVDLPMLSGCTTRDFRIEVYHNGSGTPDFVLGPNDDPDLQERKIELYTEDNVVAVIANTFWSNTADVDQDGCVASPGVGQFMRLNWDADVAGSGVLQVYEKVYWKNSGTTNWTLLHTGTPRLISGTTAADIQTLNVDSMAGCALVDYRIEIYRVGNSFPDQVRDSNNDSNLSQHREETYLEDTMATLAVVTTNWWTQVIDNDKDGCVAPTLPNGYIRLNWDPDVAGAGTLTVVGKVYWRGKAGGGWSLVASTPPQVITAGSAADYQSVDLFGGTGCSLSEYKIEISRVGVAVPDFTLDASVSPSLMHMEESYAEDVGAPPTILTQPASQTVPPGGDATFEVTAEGSGELQYQWFYQATNALPGAIARTLSLRKVQASEAGEYKVVVSNNAGSTTSAAARLSVQTATPPSLQNPRVTSGGAFQFNLVSATGAVLAIETSVNLGSWQVLTTVTNQTGNDLFSDPAGTSGPRFYRVRNTQ